MRKHTMRGLVALVTLLVLVALVAAADPFLRVDEGQDRNGTIWRGSSRERFSYPVPANGNQALGFIEYMRVIDAKSLVPGDYRIRVNGGNVELRLVSGPVVSTAPLGTPVVGNGLVVVVSPFASNGDEWTFTVYDIPDDKLTPWHPLHPGDPFFLSIGDYDAAGDGLATEKLYPADIWPQFTGNHPRVRLDLVQPGMVATSTTPRRHFPTTPNANVLMSLVNTNEVNTPTSPADPATGEAIPWRVRFLNTAAQADRRLNAYVLLYPKPGGTGPHNLNWEYAGIGSLWNTQTHNSNTYANDQFVSVRVDQNQGVLREPDLLTYQRMVNDPLDPTLTPADLNGLLPAWYIGPDVNKRTPNVYQVRLVGRIPLWFWTILFYNIIDMHGNVSVFITFSAGGGSLQVNNWIPGVALNLNLAAPVGSSAKVYVNEVNFMVRDRAASTVWPSGGDMYVFYTNQPGTIIPAFAGYSAEYLGPFAKQTASGGHRLTRPGQCFLGETHVGASEPYLEITGAGPFIYPSQNGVKPPQAASACRRDGDIGHVGYVKAEYQYPFANMNQQTFWWDYAPAVKTDFFVSDLDAPAYLYDQNSGTNPANNDRPVEQVTELFDLRGTGVRVNAAPFLDITTFDQDGAGVRPGARSEMRSTVLENREPTFFTLPARLAGSGDAYFHIWVQPEPDGSVNIPQRHWTVNFTDSTHFDMLAWDDNGNYDAANSHLNVAVGAVTSIGSLRVEVNNSGTAESAQTRFTFETYSGNKATLRHVKYNLAKSLSTSPLPWPVPGNPGNWQQPVPLTRQDVSVEPEEWTVWSSWTRSVVNADSAYADAPMDPTQGTSANNPVLPKVEERGAQTVRISLSIPNFQPPSGDAPEYGLTTPTGSSPLSQLLHSQGVSAAYWGSIRAFSDLYGEAMEAFSDNDFTASGDYMLCPFCGSRVKATASPGTCPVCGAPLYGETNKALAEDYDILNLRVSVPRIFAADTDQETIDLGLVAPGVDASAPYGPYNFSADGYLHVLNSGNVPIQVLGGGSELQISMSPLLKRSTAADGSQLEQSPILGTNLHWDPFTSTPLMTQYVGRLAGRVNEVPLRLGLPAPDPVPVGQPVGTYSGTLSLSSTAGAEPLQAEIKVKARVVESPLLGYLGLWQSNGSRPKAVFAPDPTAAQPDSRRLVITYTDANGAVQWISATPVTGGLPDPNYRTWQFAPPVALTAGGSFATSANIAQADGTINAYIQEINYSSAPGGGLRNLYVSHEGAAPQQLQLGNVTALALRDLTAPAGIPQPPHANVLAATSYATSSPHLMALILDPGATPPRAVHIGPIPIGMSALTPSESATVHEYDTSLGEIIRPRIQSLSYTKEPTGFLKPDLNGNLLVYLAYTGFNDFFGNEDIYLSRFCYITSGGSVIAGDADQNYGRLPFARIGTTGLSGQNPREALGRNPDSTIFFSRHLDWLVRSSVLTSRNAPSAGNPDPNAPDPDIYLEIDNGGTHTSEQLTWDASSVSYDNTTGLIKVQLTNPTLAGVALTIDPVHGRLQFGQPITASALGVDDVWLTLAYSPFTWRATRSVRSDSSPVLLSSIQSGEYILFWERGGYEQSTHLMYKLCRDVGDYVTWGKEIEVPMRHKVHEGDFTGAVEDYYYDNGGGDTGLASRYWLFWTSSRTTGAAPAAYSGLDLFFESLQPDPEAMIQEQ